MNEVHECGGPTFSLIPYIRGNRKGDITRLSQVFGLVVYLYVTATEFDKENEIEKKVAFSNVFF